MTPSQIAKNLIERIDEKIVALDIRAALEKSVGAETLQSIRIHVQQGSVIVSGTLGSRERFFGLQRALSVAAPGRTIQNRLSVAPPQQNEGTDERPTYLFTTHGNSRQQTYEARGR